MTDATSADVAADQVEELHGLVVHLAETLDTAERAVAKVRADCERLGLGARMAPVLDRLVIPSEAAEHLQDELNRLAGELGTAGHRPSDPDAPPTIDTPAPQPVAEHVSVQCRKCGTHIPIPDAVPEGVERAELDDRTYVCPNCGDRDTFEIRDHFVEPDPAGG